MQVTSSACERGAVYACAKSLVNATWGCGHCLASQAHLVGSRGRELAPNSQCPAKYQLSLNNILHFVAFIPIGLATAESLLNHFYASYVSLKATLPKWQQRPGGAASQYLWALPDSPLVTFCSLLLELCSLHSRSTKSGPAPEGGISVPFHLREGVKAGGK